MVSQFVKFLCFVLFAGAFTFAQDQPATDVQKDQTAWNTVCPVEGDAVNPDVTTVKYDNKHYGFCGPSCAAVFSEEPAVYAANLNEDGTQFVKQTEKIEKEE
jgi:YHS domain-containing protein